MRRIIFCVLLLIAGIVNTARADIVDVLQIDNKIVYYDLIGNSPCFPYLLDDNNAYYCSVDDTIYYGNQLTIKYPIIVKYFILAHEDGHSEDYLLPYESTFEAEQYADCYGGKQMKKLYDIQYIDLIQLQQLSDFIHSLPPGDHGTAAERYAAFAQGYLYDYCGFDIL